VLSGSARDLLRSLAGSITAGGSPAPVTVRGFAADPPGSTDAGRRELAEHAVLADHVSADRGRGDVRHLGSGVG